MTKLETILSNPAPHRIDYARVSSVGQNLDLQLDSLQKVGCKKIFTDKMTGSRMDRLSWDQLMEYVRPDDLLVVTELSRKTRSLINLLEMTQLLDHNADSLGLLARKYRYQHRYWSLFPVG